MADMVRITPFKALGAFLIFIPIVLWIILRTTVEWVVCWRPGRERMKV